MEYEESTQSLSLLYKDREVVDLNEYRSIKSIYYKVGNIKCVWNYGKKM